MDEETERLMTPSFAKASDGRRNIEGDLDEDVAEKAQELIEGGLDEDEAVEIAGDL